MIDTIHPDPAYQVSDFQWMIGRAVTKVVFQEPASWSFELGSGLAIRAECPWRIVSNGRIALSIADHGQEFGLAAPMDAAAAATALLAPARITGVQLRDGTADFLMDCVGDLRLEIIPLSRGYESWQWCDPDGNLFIVQGGGNIVKFPKCDA